MSHQLDIPSKDGALILLGLLGNERLKVGPYQGLYGEMVDQLWGVIADWDSVETAGRLAMIPKTPVDAPRARRVGEPHCTWRAFGTSEAECGRKAFLKLGPIRVSKVEVWMYACSDEHRIVTTGVTADLWEPIE